jgi:ABC-2 type transport system ATP-binding protein
MQYGNTLALNQLNLKMVRGDIYGLIGPNGAGKTTTFKIVSTILNPTSGLVRIDGLSLRDPDKVRAIRRKIGYMPDSFGVYEDMTVEEYLAFFAAAYDILEPQRTRLVEDVLDLVDLSSKRKSLIEELSRGMQQRLGIARVLIHDPDLLILDEPASGLDPRARIEIRSLLLELQKMGKTILISSHILADLGEICTKIGIIEKGVLLVNGTLTDVLKMVKPSQIVYARVNGDIEKATGIIAGLPFVTDVTVQGDTVVIQVKPGFTEPWQISQALVGAGIKLEYLEQESQSLERAFIELTEGAVS